MFWFPAAALLALLHPIVSDSMLMLWRTASLLSYNRKVVEIHVQGNFVVRFLHDFVCKKHRCIQLFFLCRVWATRAE
jgi:hypothetical protein